MRETPCEIQMIDRVKIEEEQTRRKGSIYSRSEQHGLYILGDLISCSSCKSNTGNNSQSPTQITDVQYIGY